MKRQELIGILHELIPSFHKIFIDEDIYGKDGWLVIEGHKNEAPETIPPNFLEGLKVIRSFDGLEWTVMRSNAFEEVIEERKRNGLPISRKVTLSYFNFPGNPHRYAKINIQGVELMRKTEKGYATTFMNENDVPTDHPELKHARYNWELSLGRLVTEEDIMDRCTDWSCYEEGSRTNRFTDITELKRTGVYLALKRVQGPLFMVNDHMYTNEKKQLMLSVDANENITFYNDNEKIILTTP